MQLAFPLQSAYRETAEETFWRVYQQMRVKSRRRAPEVAALRLRWRPFANSIGTLRIRDGCMQVSLSEALRAAPPEVVEALAEILAAKVLRLAPAPEFVALYRHWVNQAPTRNTLEQLRRRSGRKQTSGAQGVFFDLRELFDTVNTRYFAPPLAPVELAWSRNASRSHLGHWDPAHRTIVLSRFLDRAETPRLVAEYVMFHEMLHVVHPVEFANGRRQVHHRRFKDDERRFQGLKEARAELKRLCAGGFSF